MDSKIDLFSLRQMEEQWINICSIARTGFNWNIIEKGTTKKLFYYIPWQLQM